MGRSRWRFLLSFVSETNGQKSRHIKVHLCILMAKATAYILHSNRWKKKQIFYFKKILRTDFQTSPPAKRSIRDFCLFWTKIFFIRQHCISHWTLHFRFNIGGDEQHEDDWRLNNRRKSFGWSTKTRDHIGCFYLSPIPS